MHTVSHAIFVISCPLSYNIEHDNLDDIILTILDLISYRPGFQTSDGHGVAGSKAVETTASRVGRATDQDVPPLPVIEP